MLPEKDQEIERIFPQLAITGYRITSPKTAQYNCIAWAVGKDNAWWWPHFSTYWPEGVKEEETLEAFIQAYQTLGYQPCDSFEYEDSFEKIAIFTNNNIPTHASRQIDEKTWASKLGKEYDIIHSMYGLNSPVYGSPTFYMKRIKS